MYVTARPLVLSDILGDVWTISATLALVHGSDGRGYEKPELESRVEMGLAGCAPWLGEYGLY